MQQLKVDIGQKIRAMRKKKGISLRDFEKITGIARGDLSKMETGKRNLTLDTIEHLAKCLKCDVEFLLTEK